jgi:hypothetical protein
MPQFRQWRDRRRQMFELLPGKWDTRLRVRRAAILESYAKAYRNETTPDDDARLWSEISEKARAYSEEGQRIFSSLDAWDLGEIAGTIDRILYEKGLHLNVPVETLASALGEALSLRAGDPKIALPEVPAKAANRQKTVAGYYHRKISPQLKAWGLKKSEASRILAALEYPPPDDPAKRARSISEGILASIYSRQKRN